MAYDDVALHQLHKLYQEGVIPEHVFMEEFRKMSLFKPSFPVAGPPPTPPSFNVSSGPTVYTSEKLVSMLAMRLHAQAVKAEFINAHHSGDKVFLFIVQNGQPLTLEDEFTMYPSDTLVTKVRLVLGYHNKGERAC